MTAAFLMLIGCSSEEQRRYDAYLSQDRGHEADAIAIVSESKAAKRYLARTSSARGDDDRRQWMATPDVDTATRSMPWFCPGEYLVWFGTVWNDDTAPTWEVSLRDRKIALLETLAEIQAERDSGQHKEDDDRIEPCLDGKTPVSLDPGVISDGN